MLDVSSPTLGGADLRWIVPARLSMPCELGAPDGGFLDRPVHPFDLTNTNGSATPFHNTGQDEAHRDIGPGDAYHSDTSWRLVPTWGAVLRAVHLPDVGGDTIWVDANLAYEGLSDELKQRLDGLHVTHDFREALTSAGHDPDPGRAALRRSLTRNAVRHCRRATAGRPGLCPFWKEGCPSRIRSARSRARSRSRHQGRTVRNCRRRPSRPRR